MQHRLRGFSIKRNAAQAGLDGPDRLETPGASGSTQRSKQPRLAETQASSVAFTSYTDIKCHSHVMKAIDLLPAGDQKASNLYLLLAHAAEGTVDNSKDMDNEARQKSIDEFLEGFAKKTVAGKCEWLKARGKTLTPKEKIDASRFEQALSAKYSKTRHMDTRLNSVNSLQRALANFKAFSDFAQSLKTSDAHHGSALLRELCFRPGPLQTALELRQNEDSADPRRQGMIAAYEMRLARLGMDPRVLLEASKGPEAMLEQLRQLYIDRENCSSVKNALMGYRVNVFPLHMDFAMKDYLQNLILLDTVDDIRNLKKYCQVLPIIPYFHGMSEKTFLDLDIDKQVQLYKKYTCAKLSSSADTVTKSYLLKILTSSALKAYKARLTMKTEPGDLRIPGNSVRIDMQEGKSSEVHAAWDVTRTRTIFDENVDLLEISTEKLPPITLKQQYEFTPEHNKRWPWGDVDNFGQVHPAFSHPDDPTRCADNIVIGKVKIQDREMLYKLYKDELPNINAVLLESRSTARAPKMMTPDEFTKKIEAGISEYLEAVKKSEIPACYENQQVVRLKPDHCDDPEEVAALVGDGKNAQNGIVLNQYEIENQPLAAYGRIVGIFSGIELNADTKKRYLDTLGEELGERYLATDGMALKGSTANTNTLATLGFGNQMRCMNTGATKQPSGIVRSDREKCSVVFSSAQVSMTDKDGEPRLMQIIFGLQYRPVEKDKQLKGYYGSQYRLDSSDAAGPGSSTQVKEEPED